MTETIWKMIGSGNYSEKERALKLSAELDKFFRLLKLRTTLAELGINDQDFSTMADRATGNGTKTVGHYIPLDKAKFIAVLNLAL